MEIDSERGGRHRVGAAHNPHHYLVYGYLAALLMLQYL